MTSIKQIANCIGVSGNISIVHDFYGFTQPLSFATLVSTSSSNFLSLLSQVRLLKGRHIHLNIITVGIDQSDTDKQMIIDNAIHRMRTAYAKVNVGIGRIMHFAISQNNANGYDTISSDSDAEDLTNEWTVHNNGLDVFIVRSISDAEGKSPTGGTCEKDDCSEATGCVIELNGVKTGSFMGHEVGHYLGLPHFPDIEAEDIIDISIFSNDQLLNIMFPLNVAAGMQITEIQGLAMKAHCAARFSC